MGSSLWFAQQGLEPMIYHTPGGHANYYTTTVLRSLGMPPHNIVLYLNVVLKLAF
jgi:hypothetical protein